MIDVCEWMLVRGKGEGEAAVGDRVKRDERVVCESPWNGYGGGSAVGNRLKGVEMAVCESPWNAKVKTKERVQGFMTCVC